MLYLQVSSAWETSQLHENKSYTSRIFINDIAQPSSRCQALKYDEEMKVLSSSGDFLCFLQSYLQHIPKQRLKHSLGCTGLICIITAKHCTILFIGTMKNNPMELRKLISPTAQIIFSVGQRVKSQSSPCGIFGVGLRSVNGVRFCDST